MVNNDRVDYAFMGFFAGCAATMISMPVFFMAGINPALWFMFGAGICMPLGAYIGWRNAEKIKAWGRTS